MSDHNTVQFWLAEVEGRHAGCTKRSYGIIEAVDNIRKLELMKERNKANFIE